MGEISTLVRLIGFVDMPCWSLPFTSCTLDSFQSLKSSLLPEVHGDSVQINSVLVWVFPSDILPRSFDLSI
jgi:hypothetical protein